TCPIENPETECPDGVPVIPTKPGALGELLNNAPLLVERLSTLTERLTELLSDRNQKSIASILDNVERLTGSLADRSPEIAATLAEARVAIQQAGKAAEEFSRLAATSNDILDKQGRPLVADLQKSVQAARSSMENLDAAIAEARPGLHTFSTRTMPEVDLLVRDLRTMSRSLSVVAEKIDQQGAGSLLGSPKLPDYEGK
ncbi:MAG TPA: MCE family protein, partial [Rhizorhapis sp.]|nr:MCE family protein [Rhizorhapis sp.]